jgi:2-amino-4-hydroxy-6-hydroxymethyldihydropteridine diphosphokinase
MATIYLALGSNLGDRLQSIERALNELKRNGIRIYKISSIIETDPIDSPSSKKYLNAVLKANTLHSPEELFVITQSIEQKLGRVRKIFHGERTIDIDILLYDDLKIISKRLIIPHPRMLEREFVMNPLREIDPRLCASLTP